MLEWGAGWDNINLHPPSLYSSRLENVSFGLSVPCLLQVRMFVSSLNICQALAKCRLLCTGATFTKAALMEPLSPPSPHSRPGSTPRRVSLLQNSRPATWEPALCFVLHITHTCLNVFPHNVRRPCPQPLLPTETRDPSRARSSSLPALLKASHTLVPICYHPCFVAPMITIYYMSYNPLCGTHTDGKYLLYVIANPVPLLVFTNTCLLLPSDQSPHCSVLPSHHASTPCSSVMPSPGMHSPPCLLLQFPLPPRHSSSPTSSAKPSSPLPLPAPTQLSAFSPSLPPLTDKLSINLLRVLGQLQGPYIQVHWANA